MLLRKLRKHKNNKNENKLNMIEGSYLMSNYVYPYLNNEISEDWNFIRNFNYRDFYDRKLEKIQSITGIYLFDIFYVDDYRKYFEKYSIKNMDKRVIKASNKIINDIDSIINELLKEYGEGKEYYITEAIKMYLNSCDKQIINKYLFGS